ncbi:MAG: glycoside hydrolase family 3 N-terminal domain-containing protein, partial [Bacteroidota bacterium]
MILLLVITTTLSAQSLIPSWYDPADDGRIDSVLALMTLEEKVGQMTLFTSDWAVTGPTLREGYREDIKAGKVGAIFNAHTAEYNRELQRMAVEETRLGIPLIFGYDVIHGYRTIFPVPLGEAASWNLEAAEESARIAAVEAASAGLHWTFAPMVDIARDPRWGRIMEGAGEDVFLGSEMASARVRGFQGKDLSDPFTVIACAKHFAAYGAAQAGRDYHTVDISDRVLREIYLPPFKAALDAGVASYMTSFNEVDGVPASGSHYLLTEILRDEWGFDGFVVTDYTSINEMMDHGVAADLKGAAHLSAEAGVDMDMQGAAFYDHLVGLVENGDIPQSRVNDAVRNILRMKFALGLFDDPYKYSNPTREAENIFTAAHREASRRIARESMVLLQNENDILPLSADIDRLALIGPLGDSQADMLGAWHGAGRAEECVSL